MNRVDPQPLVTALQGEPTLVITLEFAAPRQLVWRLALYLETQH